ncbi:MAG: acyl-CoA synthetase, partial [Proteobacteria bacterium]|nr:acyl-CoA synthetase [Pseudomonadota bacterium]
MIKARVEPQNPGANLGDYQQARDRFSWAEAERHFTWSRTGRVNIVHEAVDRWCEDETQGAKT